MVIGNVSTCPTCRGVLKYYDSVERIVRTIGGASRHIKVKRVRCVDCGKLHRVLPDNISPYKHYESKIIKDVINGIITPDTLGFEDYPCEMTMNRWTRKKHTPL